MLELTTWIQIAGGVQLAIALCSLAIPRELGWREETRRLEPLTREVFWTYAAYIWGTNVALGLVSLLAAEELASGAVLARAICGYALLYWGARFVIQLTTFGKHAPAGLRFKLAEGALTTAFLALSLTYGAAVLGWERVQVLAPRS